jgi:ribosomal protein S18 acetylase RimI-like enzyme
MMRTVAFRPLQIGDAAALSALLKSSPTDYVKHFTPFSFEVDALEKLISSAKKDRLIGIEVQTDQEAELAGFYMLRGLDEGYSAPMYGVFVAYKFRNKGVARLTLVHAETSCRLNQIDCLMLKVHPANTHAKKLYEAHGFAALKEDPLNKNIIMEKSLFRNGT